MVLILISRSILQTSQSKIWYQLLYILMIGITLPLTISCDDKPIISPMDNKLLQVNCILEAGKIASLYIYKPAPIDSATSSVSWAKDTLEPIQVILFKDGIRVDSLSLRDHYDSGDTVDFYKQSYGKHYVGLSHIIQQGANYRVEIKKPGYPFLFAECFVPHAVKFLSIDTINKNFRDSSGNFSYSSELAFYYKITFSDPVDEKNYYLLEGSSTYPNIYGTENYPYYFQGDPIFENNNKSIFTLAFFSDAVINGKTYTIIADAGQHTLGGANVDYSSKITISLVSASKEYYNRVKSEYQNMLSMKDNYAEPVQLYNNIHNGIGIFAGIAKSTKTFNLR